MSEQDLKLFEALWKCMDELQLNLLEEIEKDGEKGYQKLSARDIVTLWEAFFCEEMVQISIAPNKQKDVDHPSRAALSKWKKGDVNNQLKNTILTNFIPQLSVGVGHYIIDAQKDHLVSIIERSECSKKSEWKPDWNGDKYILQKDLKSRDSLITFIYQRFNQLRELFEDYPLHLIAKEHSWFYSVVEDRIPEISNDETEKIFASIFAAAMIMALNVRDKKSDESETSGIPEELTRKVDNNIENYLKLLLGETEKKGNKPIDESKSKMKKEDVDKTASGLKRRISSDDVAFIVERKLEEFEQMEIEYTDTSIIDDIVSYRHFIDDKQFGKIRDFFLKYIKELERIGQIDSAKWIHCVIALTLLGLRGAEQRIDALKENLDNERYSDQRERILQTIRDYERRIFLKELEVDDLRIRLFEKELDGGMQF